jgi:hypothetical protein
VSSTLAQRSAHNATSGGTPIGDNFLSNSESLDVDRRLLLATLALPLLPACGRTEFAKAPYNPVNLGDYEILEPWPAVGAEMTAQVGNTLAKTVNFAKLPALEVASTYRKTSPYRKGLDMAIDIPAGKLELAATDGVGGKYYRAVPGVKLWWSKDGGFADPDTTPGGIHVNQAGAAMVYWTWGRDSANFIPAPDFVVKPTTHTRPLERTGFQKELVYSGVSGSTVSLLYREFLDNMTRPLLTQELQYDIGRSKTIGFKDARIEVVDAGNTAIRYRVVAPLK